MTFRCPQHPGVVQAAGERCHLCDAEEARRTVEAECPRCKGSGEEKQGPCMVFRCGRCGGSGRTMVTPEEARLGR